MDLKFRDRAPRLVREGDYDQWYADGVKFGSIGTNQQAGLRFEAPEKLTLGGRMDTVRRGGYDPDAHVEDMDLDSVAGGVLYPSQGLTVYAVPNSELLSAILRTYNDWLAEFCRPYPNRLKGLAMLNVDDPEDATRELQRAAGIGLAGAMVPLRPMDHRYDHPMYEPLWAAAQDLDMPLSLHVGTYRWSPEVHSIDQEVVELTNRDCDVRNALGALIFGGVVERYPRLKVVAAEFEVAWIPYFLARMDNVYMERAEGRQIERFKNDMLPSELFRRNVFISFQEDDLGIRLRSIIGVENLMWGSDYPHAESTFPRSSTIVERILTSVPAREQALIAGENAARLYHFNSP